MPPSVVILTAFVAGMLSLDLYQKFWSFMGRNLRQLPPGED